MNLLKQSTAKVINFGPFVSPTDGVTLQTGLISAIDHATTGIMLSKAGGALAVRSATVTASTYDAYGNYLVTLSTTDTNTLGKLRMQFAAAASCCPVWEDFEVVTANIYDSLVAGTDILDVSMTQLLGAAQSATDLQDFADAGYDPATNKVQGVVLVDTTTTNTDMRGTDSAALASVCTEGRLAELDAANLPTDLAAVKVDTAATLVDTAEIGAAGAGLTALATQASVTAIKAKTDSLTFTVAGQVDANMLAITGDTGSATKLERVLSGNTTGTVGAASSTTSVVTSALNPAASVTDQYKGLILKFDDATTTAALRGQGTDITASTAAGVLTCTALTTAPVSGDIFTIS